MVRIIAFRGRCIVRGKRRNSTRETYFRVYHLTCRWGGWIFASIAGGARSVPVLLEPLQGIQWPVRLLLETLGVLLETPGVLLETLGYCWRRWGIVGDAGGIAGVVGASAGSVD